MIEGKFEYRAPSAQTMVDIFKGKWASNLDSICEVTNTGKANVFRDQRIKMSVESLGQGGRFDGYSILELGPLEAAHTYQLETLGASTLVAIESNTEAFLKCLVVKELLGLKASFLCGDFNSFLEETTIRYDLIFASGVLYHMSDPVQLIKNICDHTGKCFLWTHYQTEEGIKRRNRKPRSGLFHGFSTVLHEVNYPDMAADKFWGGNKPVAAWMEQGEIIRAFENFGLKNHTILQDHKDHPAGAAFSAAFWS